MFTACCKKLILETGGNWGVQHKNEQPDMQTVFALLVSFWVQTILQWAPAPFSRPNSLTSASKKNPTWWGEALKCGDKKRLLLYKETSGFCTFTSVSQPSCSLEQTFSSTLSLSYLCELCRNYNDNRHWIALTWKWFCASCLCDHTQPSYASEEQCGSQIASISPTGFKTP